MKVKIDCPMCSLTELEEDICPNCEANLFLYRMLLEVPAEDIVKQQSNQKWSPILPMRMVIICLLMGIGVTTFVNSLFAGQKQPILTSSISASEQIVDKVVSQQSIVSPKTSFPTSLENLKEAEKTSRHSCGGLYYTVRRGNSLSLIASHFYGDVNSWSHIITSNPQLKGREDLLKIGEVLLIPNLEKYCTSKLT